MRPLSIIALSLAAVGIAGIARAAPGDLLSRLKVPFCPTWPGGPAFDGRVLYYTALGGPATVYKMDPITGSDLGSFDVKRGGVQIGDGLGGLAFDPNRDGLWIGSGAKVHGVRLSDGEVFQTIFVIDTSGIECVAYDPYADMMWESDTDYTPPVWSGWSPADGFLDGRGTEAPDAGLAFDGKDFWHFASSAWLPPAPQVNGTLFPTVPELPDWSRVVYPPGRDFGGLAYDCITFGKPAIWLVELLACNLVAFEVASTAPCSILPSPRILSTYAPVDRSLWATRLPVVPANADRLFRAPAPLDATDPFSKILTDPNRPLVFYRWVDAQGNPQGNVLRLTADRAGETVRFQE